jgi:hypothetical protein
MTGPFNRIFLGCVAGALAMLIFHQTTLQVLFWFGLSPLAAFRVAHVPPFNVPMVVSLTFWGAMYGGLFAAVASRLPGPLVVRGLIAGLFGLLMAWFVVRPLAGHEIAFGWDYAWMLRSALAYAMWGIGTALLLPMMNPRDLVRRSRAWAHHHHLAT